MKNAFKEWLNGLEAEVYDEGIQKLVTGYDKCLNVCDDYLGMGFCNSEIYIFLFLFCLVFFIAQQACLSG